MENTNVLPMPESERLDEVDQLYLSAALAKRNEANGIVAFVQSQLAVRYKLGEGDQIQPDGVIIRKRTR